jgi:hypothetical protein
MFVHWLLLRGHGIFPLICDKKVRLITGEKWHVPEIYTIMADLIRFQARKDFTGYFRDIIEILDNMRAGAF